MGRDRSGSSVGRPVPRYDVWRFMTSIEDDLRLAGELAALAAERILPHYRVADVTYKADGSAVTEADHDAEAAIRHELAARRPTDAVLGEEYGGDEEPVAGRQWLIDPIDGTTSFALGLPLFGTLIALAIDGEVTVGVVNLPIMGELLYAGIGLGCWLRLGNEAPQQVHVANAVGLSEATVSSTAVHATEVQPLAGTPVYSLQRLVGRVARYRPVGDCVQHALVCRGRLHGAFDTVMRPWDSAALLPCIREAGGIALGLNGQSERVAFAGSLVSACDRGLAEAMIEALRPES